MPAVLLVVALLACLALPAAAGAQERQLEPTIVVDSATASATAPVASTTTLQAGQSYLLVVNGQYTETFPTTDGATFTYFMDGVYCYDENPARPEFGCRTRPQVFERSGLNVRLGSPGDGSAENFRPFYTKLGNTTAPPPFVAGHRYEQRFTPPFGGRLLMAVTRDPNSTYAGTLGVELWGEPVPGDGSTGPSGDASPDLQDLLNNPEGCAVPLATPISAPAAFRPIALPGDDFCPRRLRARTWNRPGRIAVLEPGDEAIVSSPQLSPTQRSATVTLGTTGGDIVVTLSDEDARFRRVSRAACVFIAGSLAFNELRASGLLEPNAVTAADAGSFLELSGLGKYLVACLTMVDDQLAATTRPGALRVSASSQRPRARAAASGCATRRVPIRLSASQATSRLRIAAQRKGAPPPTLKVTCLMTRAGLQVRVRPTKPGVSLRKLVGTRLKVGLARLPDSKRTAGPTISFRR